jgi:hypothetical protein
MAITLMSLMPTVYCLLSTVYVCMYLGNISSAYPPLAPAAGATTPSGAGGGAGGGGAAGALG